MTETFKRTRKWTFYIPYDQKQAKKEYKKRRKANDLKDLAGIPTSFINQFNQTNQKQYEQYRVDQKKQIVSQIDIVRLMIELGADEFGVGLELSGDLFVHNPDDLRDFVVQAVEDPFQFLFLGGPGLG